MDGSDREAVLNFERWRSARATVIVAHPDDEVLGCASLLMRMPGTRIVHVTDGAPRSGHDGARHGFGTAAQYAAARRDEALQALTIAGLPPSCLTSLGIPDQDVSRNLVTLARALVPLLAATDLVVTHAFEGGHSDHDGVAFAVDAALRLSSASAERIEMPFYHGDAHGWVRQRFLPQPGAGPESVHLLSDAERAAKARMIAAHRTQAETLDAFTLDRERFRRAPHYDWPRRPHDGPLLYERHGWNLTWPEWRDRVAAARADLSLDGAWCR